MLIPFESEVTDTSWGCWGKPIVDLVFVRICFDRHWPIVIPTCWPALSRNGGGVMHGRDGGGGVTSPSSSSSEESASLWVSSPCSFAVWRAALRAFSFCFHAHKQTTPSDGNPFSQGVGLALGFKFTPWSRTLRIWVLISPSLNSSENERSGSLGPGYSHILATRYRSGWIWWSKNVHNRCMPVRPTHHNYWTTSRTGYNLLTSFFTTPYLQLWWGVGQWLMNVESDASALFVR
jgi:hypothetical protein